LCVKACMFAAVEVVDKIAVIDFGCQYTHQIGEAVREAGVYSEILPHTVSFEDLKEFKGITGQMTFTEDGDPIKCAVIVRISDKGEFEFYKSVCP